MDESKDEKLNKVDRAWLRRNHERLGIEHMHGELWSEEAKAIALSRPNRPTYE